MQDNFPKYKAKISIIKREVPFYARFFQKFGLFKEVGKIISENQYTNLFIDAGKLSILSRMTGEDKGEITYLALGDGDTTPAGDDTILESELYRKIITDRSASVLTFYSSTFIPSTEGNNSYKEMGLFGDDASAASDSGTMFTHLLVDETKSSGQSLTINYSIIAN